MAIDLETSLLERKFYYLFDGDSDILQQTFLKMTDQTSDHIIKIHKITEASKGSATGHL
jgi:hypothetical protein